MKIVIIIGPHAVGKMTVGQELATLSGLKLFHNHMPIEMVTPFFNYSTAEGRQLVNRVRQAFFEAFIDSDATGYILTFVWAFNVAGEREYVEGITRQFSDKGHTVTWVELEADLDERIRRNTTENRVAHKPSKRDIAWSENNLVQSAQKYRLNSEPGEISHQPYLRLNTTDLSATETAQRIWTFVDS